MERVTYFNTLYNRSPPNLTRMHANLSNCQELNLPISVAEVELAIARLNLNKSPGNPTPQILETHAVNYRGIALQSVVLKVSCKVFNVRLSDWSETDCILLDEQNGFRPDRSCLDHLFVVCNIISTRKLNKSPTFVVFVDLKKAFNSVDL